MSFNGGGNNNLGGGVGGGAGGGNGGRDGRSNYGPNSPPTGSLPPFYESLKGGNAGMNAYNAANSNFLSSSAQNGQNNNNSNGNYLNMNNLENCDGGVGGGELTNLSNNNNGGYGGDNNNNNVSSKQYSLLQNAAYGIILKDEQDLEYETKMDPMQMMQNGGYNGYDVNDSMMVDLSGNVVDPLQFTATLTFSSPAEHALLDSLTDAVDLTSFLQRLPNDAPSHHSNTHSSSNGDLDMSSTPSLTPDSVSITPVHDGSCLEPFPENFVMGRGTINGYDRFGSGLNGKSSYQQMDNSPPSYSHHMNGRNNNNNNTEMHQLLSHQEQQQQQQQHNQQHNHNGHTMTQQQLQNHNNNNNHMSMSSFNSHCSPLDMDSHNSNMSLPSPGSSGMGSSLDGLLPPPDAKPLIQSVSTKNVIVY